MTMKITMRLSIRLIYIKRKSIRFKHPSTHDIAKSANGKGNGGWAFVVSYCTVHTLNYNVALYHCSLSFSFSFMQWISTSICLGLEQHSIVTQLHDPSQLKILLQLHFTLSLHSICHLFSHLMKFLIVFDFVAVLVWIKLLLHIIELCTL